MLGGPVLVEDARLIAGATVRLNDDSWPVFVQRYEIGQVITAVQSDEHALTIMVTVKPKVENMSLLSEVFILLPTGGDR